MIGRIEIENYKSIEKLSLDLGRVTVLIGANGSGKSNILEAIALCSAAVADKLDNEFLFARGIRVPDDLRFVIPAFSTDAKMEVFVSLYLPKSFSPSDRMIIRVGDDLNYIELSTDPEYLSDPKKYNKRIFETSLDELLKQAALTKKKKSNTIKT